MKLYDFEFMAKMEHCISDNCPADDFIRTADQLLSNEDKLLLSQTPYCENDFDQMVCGSIVNFLSAFAERFPDIFLKQGTAYIPQMNKYIVKAMLRDIFAGRRSAEILAELLLEPSAPKAYFAEAAATAVFCQNNSFFEYFVRKTENPAKYLSRDMYQYLADKGSYSKINKIMKNASRDDIVNIYRRLDMGMESVRIDCKKQEIEYIYELAAYIPDIGSGDAFSCAVSDLIKEIGMPVSFFKNINSILEMPYKEIENDPTIYTWKYMKEHGLCLRTLDQLFGIDRVDISDEDKPELLSILKEYAVPILDKQPHLSDYYFERYTNSQRELIMSFIDIMGTDRLILDCTETYFDNDPRLFSAPLIEQGAEIILNRDLKNSNFIFKLLNTPDTLKYMLNNEKFTPDEVDTLVEMCVDKKLLNSLNIIKKYIDEHFLQK